jgi:hypothetical protein
MAPKRIIMVDLLLHKVTILTKWCEPLGGIAAAAAAQRPLIVLLMTPTELTADAIVTGS